MKASPVALDTTVVMRLLVQQPADQFHRAAVYLEDCLDGKVPVHVSDLVLAETYFALQHHYRIPKPDALRMLAAFVAHAGVATAPHVAAILAEPGLARSKPGFVDRLIHAAGQASGHTLATFEKPAGKLPGTVVL